MMGRKLLDLTITFISANKCFMCMIGKNSLFPLLSYGQDPYNVCLSWASKRGRDHASSRYNCKIKSAQVIEVYMIFASLTKK